jgi:hypothetical protein
VVKRNNIERERLKKEKKKKITSDVNRSSQHLNYDKTKRKMKKKKKI